MVSVVGVRAQAVVGTWQGTVPDATSRRVVLRIGKTDAGGLRGVFVWVDRDTSGIPLSTVSFAAPNLIVEADVVHVQFRGRLAADGKKLEGDWTQEGKTFPVTLVAVSEAEGWKHESAASSVAMAGTADPSFEVATIKPSQPGPKGRTFGLRTRVFTAKNATLGDLIKFAYGLRSRQISGAPGWLDEDRFAISAEPDVPGIPNEAQDRLMLRKLLVERFGLRFRTVSTVFPVYALTLGQGPLKLARTDPALNSHAGIVPVEGPDGDTQIRFVDETLLELAGILMNFIDDRQIVDETGLEGAYDFSFSVPTAALKGTESAAAFFRAVGMVGLKLVPKQALLDVMVVEGVAKPSAN